jgi:uncharacterized protein (DUF885 family)
MQTLSRRTFLLSTAAIGVAACIPMSRHGSASGPGAAAQARAVYAGIFEEMLVASPETATGLGLDTGNRAALKSRLADASPAGKLNYYAPILRALPQLKAIRRDELDGRDLAWLDTALWFAERSRETASIPYGAIGGYFYPVPYVLSQLTGSYQSVPSFLNGEHQIENEADAEAYLDRLDQFHRNIDLDIEAARSDAARGVIPPAIVVEKALAQSRSLRSERGASAGLVSSLTRRTSEKQIAGNWQSRAARIVEGPIAAALDRQIALLGDWPRLVNGTPGVLRLPEGERLYAQALRFHTSTNLSAAEIHRMGIAQVAELNAEAEPLLRNEGLTRGSVGARISELGRLDRHLFANNDAGREQLLASIREDLIRLRARMPELFYSLPTSGMEVRRVPPAIELGSPFAYAEGGSVDGSRPGIYYINLANTATIPRWALPTLNSHEAIPGHLWEGAIQRPAQNIPLLFRSVGIPAFGEGWGLYAETLRDELGLYEDDPLGRIGMIQSFLFRAARLVVDTGLHAMGWSRERAIRYFMDTVGREQFGSEREIDRYLVWPGQATSYKIGHNEILRIRDETRRRLGSRFDIRAFHDLVLLSGSMPLEVLSSLARDWDGDGLS